MIVPTYRRMACVGLISFNLHNSILRWVLLLSPLYRRGNRFRKMNPLVGLINGRMDLAPPTHTLSHLAELSAKTMWS